MKKAFTLVEIMICMAIIGTLAVIMLSSINNQGFDEKEWALKAHKTIRLIDEMSAQIIQKEVDQLPTGAFMTDTTGSYEYAICATATSCSTKASSKQVVDLFANYIKFEKTYSQLKTAYTGYSAIKNNSNVAGGRIAGDIYIGFLTTKTVSACPSEVYIPPFETEGGKMLSSTSHSTSDKKCWGTLYIDVNGNKKPNELGKDIYVFGMGEMGIEK